jgi:hypothetical protein
MPFHPAPEPAFGAGAEAASPDVVHVDIAGEHAKWPVDV